MMQTFGRSRGQLARIYHHTIDFLHARWKSTIFFAGYVDRDRLQLFADAVHRRGAPTINVFGFPDGTKVETCRPHASTAPEMNLQKEVYSGHKRRHCLNYQGVTAPDGICIHFYGPCEGRRHDTTLLRRSELLPHFDANCATFDGFMMYGDPAYGLSKSIMVGYKGNNLDWQKKEFNRSMRQVRQSVEWNFGRMKTLWAAIAFKMHQKIMLTPVGKIVGLAMLFTNVHCCVNRGNQISTYFGCDPPTLEEYLGL
jgi:hypothetical protein